jgi:hypothetical protein
MTETEPADAASATERASVLAQALPFLRRYAGATIVVKYGGHAMAKSTRAPAVRQRYRVAQVGVNPSSAWRLPDQRAMLKWWRSVHFVDGPCHR